MVDLDSNNTRPGDRNKRHEDNNEKDERDGEGKRDNKQASHYVSLQTR